MHLPTVSASPPPCSANTRFDVNSRLSKPRDGCLYILSEILSEKLRDIAKSVFQSARNRNARAKTIISLYCAKSYDKGTIKQQVWFKTSREGQKREENHHEEKTDRNASGGRNVRLDRRLFDRQRDHRGHTAVRGESRLFFLQGQRHPQDSGSRVLAVCQSRRRSLRCRACECCHCRGQRPQF